MFQLYVRADSRTSGTLATYLTELSATGDIVEFHPRVQATVALDVRPASFTLAVGMVDHTLAARSSIQLRVRFQPSAPKIDAYLVWDDPTTPTSVTIPAVEPTTIRLSTLDFQGVPRVIFEAATTNGTAKIFVGADASDAFGRYRITDPKLSILDSSGIPRVDAQRMRVVTGSATEYSVAFTYNLTLPLGRYTVLIEVRDIAGNTAQARAGFSIAIFQTFQFQLVDVKNRPLEGAKATLAVPVGRWTGTTNSTGWATYLIPPSETVGEYNVTVTWHQFSINLTTPIQVSPNAQARIQLPLYDMSIRIVLYGMPITSAYAELMRDAASAANGTTNTQGSLSFTRIPLGNYSLRVSYLGYAYETELEVGPKELVTIEVPFPFAEQITYLAVVVIVGSASTIAIRRRTRYYPVSFEYLNELTRGGLPETGLVTIAGGSGSGKTVLTESLLFESLKAGRPSIYITNVEFPSSIRLHMKQLGMDTNDFEAKGRLQFIDSYSAIAGERSSEKHQISSATDLTSLGIMISRRLEEQGPNTDVFLDSLTPLLVALKPEEVLNFTRSVGAKVKANGGRFCATVGTTPAKETLTKLAEMSDCVIEMQLLDTRRGQKRRLRVSKMRGKGYSDRWTRFTVHTDQGMRFYAPHRPKPESKP